MKVLICDKLDDASINKIKDAGLDVTVKTGMKPDELKSMLPGYEVMVIRSATKATSDVIDAGTDLKLIVRAGVGLDNVDQARAKEKNIEVRNTPGVTSVSVAEHTMGLMLGLARHIPQAHADLKEGRWERKKYTGTEIMGKSLGIIGFGRIGQEVAKRAAAFGMKVSAYDPHIDKDRASKLGVETSDFDTIIKNSDYISLHIPLIPETKHLFNAETLAKMKKGARIVNCARGGIVDEEALASAIKDGHISGAAFDVFEKEPPEAGNPLLGLDEFVCVPHLGAMAAEGQARAGSEVARIVIEFSKGVDAESLLSLVKI